jgi:hypothetical protein
VFELTGKASLLEKIDPNNEIMIDGTVTAPVYVQLEETTMTADQGVLGEAPYTQYLVYTDGDTTPCA